MATTAPAFNGQLNSNEIYNALFNIRILFQKFAPQTVRRDPIVAILDKSVGMYGDTGVRIGCDISGTYDFTADAQAPYLLAINRNKSQKIEKYTIDKWRQTDVTIDAYISKRAMLDPTAFETFNGYLVSTLDKNMAAFETGYVKTAIGTYTSPVDACTIEIEMPARDGTEATERIRAAKIREAILNLKDDLRDNQRKYNSYGFYASYDWDKMMPIFNAKYINEIDALALYNAFNPEFIKSAGDATRFTKKWFGNVYTAGNTTNGTNNTTSYSLIEQNSDGTDNFPLTAEQELAGTYRIFPGDLLPNGFTYKANEAYRVDETIIAKIFDPEYIEYMTGYEQGEMFHNPRSATDNHYYRKGFSPVYVSGFAPFITLKEVNPQAQE